MTPVTSVAAVGAGFHSGPPHVRIGSPMEVICPTCTSREVNFSADRCNGCRRGRPSTNWVMPGSQELFAGRYRVLHVIRSGAYGLVLKAVSAEEGELRAIKLIPRDVKGGEPRDIHQARVQDEVKHAGWLADAGLFPKVYDHASGEPAYIVMQFMDRVTGDNFHRARWESGRGFGEVEVLQKMARPYSAVLRKLAATGSVHRDLKPANSGWAVKKRPASGAPQSLSDGEFDEGQSYCGLTIFDCGESCMSTKHEAAQYSRFQKVESRRLRGTPDYMSPEIIQCGRIDWLSDQYAVGVQLYEFAARSVPWSWSVAQSPDAAENERQYERRLVTLRGELPRPPMMSKPLYRLLARMMAYDPERRYQTPDALRRAIDETLADVARLEKGRRAKLWSMQPGLPEQITSLMLKVEDHDQRNESLLEAREQLESLAKGFGECAEEERLRRTERVLDLERTITRAIDPAAPRPVFRAWSAPVASSAIAAILSATAAWMITQRALVPQDLASLNGAPITRETNALVAGAVDGGAPSAGQAVSVLRDAAVDAIADSGARPRVASPLPHVTPSYESVLAERWRATCTRQNMPPGNSAHDRCVMLQWESSSARDKTAGRDICRTHENAMRIQCDIAQREHRIYHAYCPELLRTGGPCLPER